MTISRGYKRPKNLKVGDRFKDFGTTRTVTKVVVHESGLTDVHYSTSGDDQILPMRSEQWVEVI